VSAILVVVAGVIETVSRLSAGAMGELRMSRWR